MARPPAALLALLSTLPRRPNDAELTPAVNALIEYASLARQPAMSAAAVLRSRGKALGLSAAVVSRLCAAATDHFRHVRRREARDERTRANHVPLRHAAAMLGEDPAELLAKLIDPAQRRLYGWPYWSGTEFRLPVPACMALTRAAFLTGQPATEPGAIAETLPPWCRRDARGGATLPASIQLPAAATESGPPPGRR